MGRGRGQLPRHGQQVGRPPLTPTAPPVPAQQLPQPTTTRGRGRGEANIVIKEEVDKVLHLHKTHNKPLRK